MRAGHHVRTTYSTGALNQGPIRLNSTKVMNQAKAKEKYLNFLRCRISSSLAKQKEKKIYIPDTSCWRASLRSSSSRLCTEPYVVSGMHEVSWRVSVEDLGESGL